MHAAIRCDEDDGIRAVIITGAGDKAFCAGGDLSGFAGAGDNAAVMIKEMTAYLHAGVSRLIQDGRAGDVDRSDGRTTRRCRRRDPAGDSMSATPDY